MDDFFPAELLPLTVEEGMARFGGDRETVERVLAELREQKVFLNSTYQVNVAKVQTPIGPMLHVSIKRRDKDIIRDWRELQEIKNKILGPEREAVELFPAESRLVDSANQYHLYALPPGERFPFGFQERMVCGESRGGAVQRPFTTDT